MARPFEEVISSQIPALPGTYALRLLLASAKDFTIGKLGTFSLQSGPYVYFGSGLGAGGLRARLNRHIYGGKKIHWHIDWLRRYAEVEEIWYSLGTERMECNWSQCLCQLPEVFVPVPGFGASDCRSGCQAHLFGLSARISSAQLLGKLSEVAGDVMARIRISPPVTNH